ncbi:MAG: hypothetical protein Q4G05_05290, partial [Clostridia bacterium]|nr:hypothetical protein [Clostridia bacterium]
VWSGVQEVKWDINDENERVPKVKAVLDTEGVAVPVPTDFYYIGGTVDTGVVISDNESDKDKYRTYSSVPSGYSYENDIDGDETTVAYLLEGNQFVWVPVTGGIENARSDFGINKNGGANFADYIDVFDAEYRDRTAIHNTGRSLTFDDVADYESMKTSVNNYGGFYVARYEAGSSNDAQDGTVVSQANKKPWDKITQTNAKAKCEDMYSESSSVKSLLMSSYTWDATLSFIQNKGDKKDVSNDSTSWGNYKNRRPTNNNTIEFSGYYANNGTWENIASFTGSAWATGTHASIGTYENYLKLATGIAPSTKANNIYDIAGNMFEWTTEVSKNGATNNRVLRGGGYNYNGSDRPASSRSGIDSVTYTNMRIGFRPQLFIQM